MKLPKISTIIIIICILIIGLYALGEVNYFAYKITAEENIESPVVVIPSIGVEEKINNISLDYGVLMENNSFNPNEGDVMLFGHRTLQGSPFLRLHELKIGDSILLEWPDSGELNYSVTDTFIVSPDYKIDTQEGGDNIYLITCDPIGSTANRLIIQGELEDTNTINNKIIENNPQESYALYISLAFLIIGLIISFIYPKDERIYIFITVIIISVILLYCCINPFPSDIIYDKIIWLNGGV